MATGELTLVREIGEVLCLSNFAVEISGDLYSDSLNEDSEVIG